VPAQLYATGSIRAVTPGLNLLHCRRAKIKVQCGKEFSLSKKKSVNKSDTVQDSPENKAAGTSPSPAHAFPIVGIGASAGGLAAFEAFFSGMPAETDPGMAFVLVQHLDPDHKSMLAEITGRYTRMQVFVVKNGMEVYPNCTYIIPPGYDMSFQKGKLTLHKPSAPRGHRFPIDFFFRSLARDQKDRAIAVILSGTGGDGTLGMRTIKEEGGMIMVQSPESAEFDGMPHSVISTGMADYVLPPQEMADALISYASRAFGKSSAEARATGKEKDDSLKTIFKLLREQSGHDFSHYKPTTILRRIERRMALLQIDGIESYVEHVHQKRDELNELFRDLLIGVTHFFRDIEAFSTLEEAIAEKLFTGKSAGDSIRVWSAGCSTGEEAYSIAIILYEYMATLKEEFNLQVFATDIDGQAIAAARSGIYSASIAADISPERLSNFFTVESLSSEGAPESYRIKKKIRDLLIISEQNIIKDPPFSNIDLISCRNLMIYLNGDLHKKLIPLFHYSLRPGGLLFLGTSESIGEDTDLFHTLDRRAKLFQRKDTSSATPSRSYGSFLPPMFPSSGTTDLKNRSRDAVKKIPLREVAEKTILQRLAPASALVNEDGDIFYLHGRTGMFLEPATGEVGHYNILKMAREGLYHELTVALRQVAKEGGIFTRSGLRVKTNGHFGSVNISVCPAITISGAASDPPLYLVVLEEGIDHLTEEIQFDRSTELDDGGIAELREELHAKEKYLQTVNKELETANEELKSSNEEMQSMNEELQSTNEELETSKEELQSVNEELVTVNTELQSKVADLWRTNNDMCNLLSGTGIATIFVDQKLHILRFTPTTSEVINLIGSDIGRPVGHIVSNLENYDRMVPDIQEVLESLIPKEVEVLNSKGEWFTMRILPYRSLDGRIEGAVINFVNITRLKQIEDELKKQLSEKEMLLREIHHRIKNNITSIGLLLSMQSQAVTNEEALSVLKDAISRVNSMSALYDKLLVQNDYSESSVKNYIEGLVDSLSELFFDQTEHAIDIRIEDFNLSPKKLFPLGIIINELITNTMKYAFTEKKSGLITVLLTRKDNHVTLTIQDNGRGLPEDYHLKEATGFGLTLVRMLSDQMDGNYTIEKREDSGGTRSVLEFDV
jgi:two-component system, chemotaxis family, CheB/CheR fusion protein